MTHDSPRSVDSKKSVSRMPVPWLPARLRRCCDALLEGTHDLPCRGVTVRLVAPPGAPGWLLLALDAEHHEGLEII